MQNITYNLMSSRAAFVCLYVSFFFFFFSFFFHNLNMLSHIIIGLSCALFHGLSEQNHMMIIHKGRVRKYHRRGPDVKSSKVQKS